MSNNIDLKTINSIEKHDEKIDKAIKPFENKIKKGEELTKSELEHIKQEANMAIIDLLFELQGNK